MRASVLTQAVVSPLVFALLLLGNLGSALETTQDKKVESAEISGSSSGIPVETIVEIRHVDVTLEQSFHIAEASRHDIEKERLLSTIAKDYGTWSSNHPRHRLLDALHGFSKYYEQQRADIDRLRGLYKYASKFQKKARFSRYLTNFTGFEVTINEWSMYMNAVYRFLEFRTTPLAQSVHPFVDGWSHHVSDDNMMRAVSFPDVPIHASKVLMLEGDFTTEFKNQTGYYDVVVTYFFIDTARNLMSYFETIKDVLKKGGTWINLGPLLYGTSPLVQLSLEDIISITKEMGFHYLDTDEVCGKPTFPEPTIRSIEAVYSFDHKALTKNAYNAQFWAAEKL
ncbi:hypothetical protein ED733_007857 [Metarhizium rileyi]|uniref:Uncharacterized protein n=1 Tax=Metarhizium rileyi (strain RCEF 4871) TaxID=1649241 RepID=A0A5C6GH73_METRR|nr:hypothetical protein ED733_007857 [Metarhizium rileyi]